MNNETGNRALVISLMLAVTNAQAAAEWYKKAVGATELWNFGSVIGLEIAGAAFFLGEPANNGWESPENLGICSARVEVFCDNPDEFIARAVNEGAKGGHDKIRDHETPWGVHRQGGFIDPFGHIWLVGDRSPLNVFPSH
jgi:PhnB protein